MGATKLGLYNAALTEVGDTRLATVTDSVEARYVLDGVYDRVLAHCLEAGLWNFAIRDASVASTATPSFGFGYSHPKPVDWVRTAGVSISGALSANGVLPASLDEYADQGSVWLSNVDPLFIKYVSNHASYGLDLTKWPESFTRYVELELAWRIGKRVNQSAADREQLKSDRKEAKSNALAKDAQNEAEPRRNQAGRFVRARLGYTNNRYDPLIS